MLGSKGDLRFPKEHASEIGQCMRERVPVVDRGRFEAMVQEKLTAELTDSCMHRLMCLKDPADRQGMQEI